VKTLPLLYLCLLVVPIATAADSQSPHLAGELQNLRYSFAHASILQAGSDHHLTFALTNTDNDTDRDKGSDTVPFIDDISTRSHKSPVKAFLLSLAVPGLGQYYYGSRTKPFAFIGVEAVSWFLHASWHADGNDLTNDYETFNQIHWSEDRYRTSLEWIYEITYEPDIREVEINHTLPDTRTQQYYEMTGKYSQFAWGWDDARLNDSALTDYSAANPPPRIRGEGIPHTRNRFIYEGMRHDANNKYDDARKMVYVAMANHLVAAFEAFFVTRHLNNQKARVQSDLASVELRARFRSMNKSMDTPYLAFTYKF
jgi:hypothetical protein